MIKINKDKTIKINHTKQHYHNFKGKENLKKISHIGLLKVKHIRNGSYLNLLY